MRRISRSPWWEKRGFSTLWFGGVALFVPMSIVGVVQGAFPPPVVLAPLGMAIFGYVLMRILPLMDEVSIDGDQLVVRNGDVEDRISLRDVRSFNASFATNPEQVCVVLKRPCLFGDRFAFAPEPWRTFRLGGHPLAEELNQLLSALEGESPREAP